MTLPAILPPSLNPALPYSPLLCSLRPIGCEYTAHDRASLGEPTTCLLIVLSTTLRARRCLHSLENVIRYDRETDMERTWLHVAQHSDRRPFRRRYLSGL